MAEKTTVKLQHKDNVKEFDIQHAQDLLNLEAKSNLSNWELSPNQPFEFKDGVISPTSKGTPASTGKSEKPK